MRPVVSTLPALTRPLLVSGSYLREMIDHHAKTLVTQVQVFDMQRNATHSSWISRSSSMQTTSRRRRCLVGGHGTEVEYPRDGGICAA